GTHHDARPESEGERDPDRLRQRLEAPAMQRWIFAPECNAAPAPLAHADRFRDGRGYLVSASRPVLLDAAGNRRVDGVGPAVMGQWQERPRSIPALHRGIAYAGGETSTGDSAEGPGVPGSDHGAPAGLTDSGAGERRQFPR